MGAARIPAFVLVVMAPLAGCRTAAGPGDPGSWDAPVFAGDQGAGGGPEFAPAAPEVVEKGARIFAGAWGFDGRVDGHAEGAPASYSADASGIPGFSLEARFLSRGEDPDAWSTFGFLLEHFRGSEDRAVPGGEARNEGALTGAFLSFGAAADPYRDGAEIPVDFARRFDFLVGLRRGSARVEVPDGFGSTHRKSSTWGEVAFGVRGEWSPVRRVFLFARGDIGSELNPRSLLDEEDTSGDSAVGAQSFQFVAGLRVRPLDHVSLLFGWRFLRLEGKEFFNGYTEDVGTARVSWSGPWAGLEVDF